MSNLKSTQAAALLAVAKSIREYADSMDLELYGDLHKCERNLYVQEQFHALAKYLNQDARTLMRWPEGDGT